MNYLTYQQILLAHSMIIDETGGRHGVRDREALISLGFLPKQSFGGKELYSGVFGKAAVYARNIIMSHPFVDGNKRTGITAAAVFLENNGYRLINRRGLVKNFALEIINKKLDLEKIAKWFENNSRKINDY